MGYRVDCLSMNLVVADAQASLASLKSRGSYFAELVEESASCEDQLAAILGEFGMCFDSSGDNQGGEIWEWWGEKWLSYHDDLFEAIAPGMEDGSMIAFVGEDHEIWRYVYRGGQAFYEVLDIMDEKVWR